MAIRFADRFAPEDRGYEGNSPHWHHQVRAALSALRDEGLISTAAGGRLRLTAEGADGAREAAERLAAEPAPARPAQLSEGDMPAFFSGVISAPLRTDEGRTRAGLDLEDPHLKVMIELNLGYGRGPEAALQELSRLWKRVTGRVGPEPVSDDYATGELTEGEMERLVSADAAGLQWETRTIYRIWPDFTVHKHIDASVVTVKADAARRSFSADGRGIVWAVVDSGIDQKHPHFDSDAHKTLTHRSVRNLHRSFVEPNGDTPDDPLTDSDGHGTHVAGIIAGGLANWDGPVVVTESRFNVANPNEPMRQPRSADRKNLNGMAPLARLVSLKVLNGGSFTTRVGRLISALAYVRKVNGSSDKLLRIHGVNLSLGYDFDPTWFACGQSPLCQEVDKLVRSGVVVVVAAGNSGYGRLTPRLSQVNNFGLGMTINDPGNAERAITVGATHRDSPHRYGVSYFSSKGPTGDGRRKPDLVAPGERIVSAAAGRNLQSVVLGPDQEGAAVYVEDTGTSMAAPHVSGLVAAFLSVRREFIGQPERVKQIFVDSATPLGRDPTFEGGGLVDLMRAMQSV